MRIPRGGGPWFFAPLWWRYDVCVGSSHALRRLLVWAFAGLAACAPSVYDRPHPVGEVVFPRNDAAHPAPTEWWYYPGHLKDEIGRVYGFELTFFKVYTPPRYTVLGVLPLYLIASCAHITYLGLTDLAEERFVMGEHADFWGYGAGASAQELEV